MLGLFRKQHSGHVFKEPGRDEDQQLLSNPDPLAFLANASVLANDGKIELIPTELPHLAAITRAGMSVAPLKRGFQADAGELAWATRPLKQHKSQLADGMGVGSTLLRDLITLQQSNVRGLHPVNVILPAAPGRPFHAGIPKSALAGAVRAAGPSVPAGAVPAGAATAAAKPYACPIEGCGYRAAQRRYIGEHLRVHTGRKPYACTWAGCAYSSSGSGHLQRHMRVHTGEKPYKCDWAGCKYQATQSGHLTAHKRKHTGERPFSCPMEACNYAATRSWHLARHLKNHGINDDVAVTGADLAVADAGFLTATR